MGVAGCGKSTTGKLLAEQLSLPFIEADDFHSKENVLKMSKGIPLNDEDRYPWLQSLAHELQLQEGKKGAVLACSALKESYRKILQDGLKEKIAWVYLEGDEQILKERLKNRKGHFMPEELLQSQLATLEKPDGAHTFSITMNPQEIVDDIMKVIKQ
jgi:carbohydrate kinase (thermoresistant glucokinase family)